MDLRDLREEIWTEIIARLPLRSIARFKLVSKNWKSTIESVYFRRLYVSVHQKSSSSWSLMRDRDEFIGFHGCKTWGLRKPLSFFIPRSLKVIKASSNGLVLISSLYDLDCCFVGNPVLQQWIKIPTPPSGYSSVFGLVTRVDEDGFLLGFKVVRLADDMTNDYTRLSVFLYSSETGVWSSKIIHCPYEITYRTLTLNGSIYYSHLSEPGVLVAYDFYSEESSDQFRVISLPDQPSHIYKSSLTSSGGFFMYIRALVQSSQNVVKVWRLNNDDTWQLLWEISLPLLIGEYLPMAMHPFDSDIVYLWSQENLHVVSCNLRTQNNRILKDAGNDDDDDQQDCFLNPICEYFMDKICDRKVSVVLSQLVLPRWMESVQLQTFSSFGFFLLSLVYLCNGKYLRLFKLSISPKYLSFS